MANLYFAFLQYTRASHPPANFIVMTSPDRILSVNINECRVLQVSLVLRFKFKTDLIINWIYPIKTHSRETWGKSTLGLTVEVIHACISVCGGGGGGGDCDFLDYFSKLWREVENRIYQERLNFYLSFFV